MIFLSRYGQKEVPYKPLFQLSCFKIKLNFASRQLLFSLDFGIPLAFMRFSEEIGKTDSFFKGDEIQNVLHIFL